jgi:DNA-binding Xre family transcriptional regulator
VGTIRWAVKPFALRKGITDEQALADLAGLDWQTITAVWDGRYSKGTKQFSAQIHLETVRKLCLALDARPPGVLKWAEDTTIAHRKVQDGPPFLIWRVKELAEAKGYDRISFARAARMLYSRLPGSTPMPADKLWAGNYKAIALSTLANVCEVLDVDMGDLFTTDDE